MANGSQVRTLEDLKENFDLASVLGYYDNGRLYDWLMVYYYEEEAKKLSDLDSSADDFKKSLCDILGATYTEDESSGVDLSDISERNERLAKLKTFTADDAILAAVDNVVFTQDELDSLLGNDIDVIYLCGEQFNISADKGDVRYFGVNTPKVSIPNDFTEKGIVFQGIEFDLEGIVAQAKATSDREKAVRLWRMAAEKGDAEAQYRLGECYYNGDGVEDDHDESYEWIFKSAEQGYAEAQYKLGTYYHNGYDGFDEEEAVKWYRKAAETGHAGAQYELGECYYNGDDDEDNYEEAVKWFSKAAEQWRIAAEQGHAEAQYKLGICYRKNRGVEFNLEESAKWIRKAAEQGYTEAQYEIGDCCYHGIWGFEENKEEAIKWWHQAANQGHAKAQYTFGELYRNGYSVSENKEEAVKWYRKAAKQGHAEAQYELGRCYVSGCGVDENKDEAVKWLRKADEKGHDYAKYELEELANK